MWDKAVVEIGGRSERVPVDYIIGVPWTPEIVQWPEAPESGAEVLVNGATYYVESASPCAQQFHLTLSVTPPVSAEEAEAAAAKVTVKVAKVEAEVPAAPKAPPRRGRRPKKGSAR